MSVVSLYNGIYRVLSNDETVLNYVGIGNQATALEKAKRIQKRHKPQDLATNMPVIAFYSTPGSRMGDNYLVYETNFIFDIYTNDDVSKAQKIGDRILELFEGVIHPMMGVESFESMMVSMHESAVDLANCYCFTVVINFSVSLDK
ncbi:hypothetical protein ACPA0F_18240 [Solibacillus silvestris]